mgnify:FL=1
MGVGLEANKRLCMHPRSDLPNLMGGKGRNGGREHGATAIHDSAANGWAAPPAKPGGAKNKSHGAAQPATLEQRGTTARSDTLTSPAPLERCSIGVPSGAGDMAMAVTNLCNGLMDTSKTAQYEAKHQDSPKISENAARYAEPFKAALCVLWCIPHTHRLAAFALASLSRGRE